MASTRKPDPCINSSPDRSYLLAGVHVAEMKHIKASGVSDRF